MSKMDDMDYEIMGRDITTPDEQKVVIDEIQASNWTKRRLKRLAGRQKYTMTDYKRLVRINRQFAHCTIIKVYTKREVK